MSKKLERYNQIHEMLLKENDYLLILKGYCESQQDECTAIDRILLMLETLCSLHENICDSMDDLSLDIGI